MDHTHVVLQQYRDVRIPKFWVRVSLRNLTENPRPKQKKNIEYAVSPIGQFVFAVNTPRL